MVGQLLRRKDFGLFRLEAGRPPRLPRPRDDGFSSADPSGYKASSPRKFRNMGRAADSAHLRYQQASFDGAS